MAVGMATAGSSSRRNRLSLRSREAIAGYIFLLPWIIGFLWFVLGPVVASFALSLTDFTGGGETHFLGAQNYTDMISNDPLFWQSLKVTTIFAIGSVPLGLCVALGVALLLNQHVRGLPVWRTIYYLPALVVGAPVALLWQYLLNDQFGAINTVLNAVHLPSVPWLDSETWIIPALILASSWGATAGMLIFLGGLQSIPTELYEAAMINGAGTVRRFRHITLPLLSPSILYNLIFGVIGSFQVFALVYLLTSGPIALTPGGPNYASYVYSIYVYQMAFRFGRIGYAAGLGWVLFLIMLGFTLITFRSARAWVFYAGER